MAVTDDERSVFRIPAARKHFTAGREGQLMVEIGAFVGVALFGFLAGLFSFKVKSRWCPRCGATTSDQALGRQHVDQ